MFSYDRIQLSSKYIINKIRITPTIGIILGSGLSEYSNQMEEVIEIPYSEIPDFPEATATSHKSKLLFGKLRGKYTLIMCGRFHKYEGYSMEQSAFPVCVMKALGVKTLITTNAVGAVNTDFEVGNLVVISDHIKLAMESPLTGQNVSELGPRFNDMTYAYTPKLRELAKEVSYGIGLNLREGVYAYMAGPSYETPAEVNMLRILGADVVGMSTVSEVIAAAHCGMNVLGISFVANMAAGILKEPLSGDHIIQAGKNAISDFEALIGAVIDRIE